jgi:hypothetical protein
MKKPQTPNIKHQKGLKSQAPTSRVAVRRGLKLDAWSFSGVWCLVLGFSARAIIDL